MQALAPIATAGASSSPATRPTSSRDRRVRLTPVSMTRTTLLESRRDSGWGGPRSRFHEIELKPIGRAPGTSRNYARLGRSVVPRIEAEGPAATPPARRCEMSRAQESFPAGTWTGGLHLGPLRRLAVIVRTGRRRRTFFPDTYNESFPTGSLAGAPARVLDDTRAHGGSLFDRLAGIHAEPHRACSRSLSTAAECGWSASRCPRRGLRTRRCMAVPRAGAARRSSAGAGTSAGLCPPCCSS